MSLLETIWGRRRRVMIGGATGFILYGGTLTLIALASGCGLSDDISIGSNDGGPDGRRPLVDASVDHSVDAQVDTGLPAVTTERWGARVWGNTLALTRSNRDLWIGSAGVPDLADNSTAYHAGLYRLNIDTGALDAFTDSLPTYTYKDEVGDVLGTGPVTTATAVADGERAFALSPTGLVLYEGGTFTLHPINGGDGQPVGISSGLAFDETRRKVWVTTGSGVFRLNAETLAVEKQYAEADLPFVDAGKIDLDPTTGAVFAVLIDDQTGDTAVARIQDDTVAVYRPGDQDTTTGAATDVVWSTGDSAVYIALNAGAPAAGGIVRWDGTTASTFLLERNLSQAASGTTAAFSPKVLAIDETDHLLIVGGSIRTSLTFTGGGGLVYVHLDDRSMTGLSFKQGGLPGDDVAALAYDPTTRRTYASLRYACSEFKLGNGGLYAISFRDDGSPRYERPILSGVRSLVTTESGDTYLGLRKEHAGLACDGYEVKNNFVKLHSNHSGEIVPFDQAAGGPGYAYSFGPTAVAAQGSQLALAGWRENIFFGPPTAGVYTTASAIGLSIWTNDIAFQGANAAWVAGRVSHSQSDPPELADIGAAGASLVQLDGDGNVTSDRHFVRASKDENDVGGLPSGEVYSVVTLTDGSVYLVCGVERTIDATLDRPERPAFTVNGVTFPGGVGWVHADGTVSTLIGPNDAPDPRASALDSTGALVLLDAVKGPLRLDQGIVSPFSFAVPLPAGSLPRGLWLGKNTDAVATLDTGAIVQLGGAFSMVTGVGDAWHAAQRKEGIVYIGTDEGLVRAIAPGVTDVQEPTIETGALPPFKTVDLDGGVDPDSGGTCIEEGQVCAGHPNDCCPGLFCSSSGFIQNCAVP